MGEEYEDSEFENSGEKQMYDAICSECGKECQVPFKPEKDKPVYCKECYAAKRPKRKFGFQRRTFGNGQREMHNAKCSACGIDCQVPFKPREGGSVLCKECYIKNKKE